MTSQHKRHGKSWSAEEDSQLYDKTVAGFSIDDICLKHQRSSGAIQARQIKLGLRCNETGEMIDPPPQLQLDGRKSKSTVRRYKNSASGSATTTRFERPRIDRAAIGMLIQSTPDLIERIWLAIQKDISEIHSGKVASTKDRDAHIILSRLSPGDDFHERHTLQGLAHTHNITRERVRQVEQKWLRILKSRVQTGNSWVHAVLHQDQVRNEQHQLSERYATLVRELIVSEAADRFTTFIIEAIGRIDGLTATQVGQLIDTLRNERAEKQKTMKARAKADEKVKSQKDAANSYVSAVLAKSSFTGTFAAEGLSLKELPRLRSCEGGRELYSKTLNRFVQWESHGERQFIEALDRSTIITEFAEQPVEIQFVHAGRIRKYYVDLLIKTAEDLTIAVEIKSPVMLADSDVLIKAQAAERIFGQHGIGYCLVDASGRSRQDILKARPTEELKAFLRATLLRKGEVDMRDLRVFLGEWPSQEISDQIQCLVLQHNLDYRVQLVRNRTTGKLNHGYKFTLSLPRKS